MVNKQYQNIPLPLTQQALTQQALTQQGIHRVKDEHKRDTAITTHCTNSRQSFMSAALHTGLNIDAGLDIDTDIGQLSSRKLWQILEICQIKQCELDKQFIARVKEELNLRNDYDNGKAWLKPH